MGGKSGGDFSNAALSELQKAAQDRLRQIASQSTKLLFVCEAVDRDSLDSHLRRSEQILERSKVCDGDSDWSEDYLEGVTFSVVFTNKAKETSFIDRVIDRVILRRIGGVHVGGSAESVVPSKASAYRWQSINWHELEELVRV